MAEPRTPPRQFAPVIGTPEWIRPCRLTGFLPQGEEPVPSRFGVATIKRGLTVLDSLQVAYRKDSALRGVHVLEVVFYQSIWRSGPTESPTRSARRTCPSCHASYPRSRGSARDRDPPRSSDRQAVLHRPWRGRRDRRGSGRGQSTATRNDRRHPRRFIQRSGVGCDHSAGRAAALAAKTIVVILSTPGSDTSALAFSRTASTTTPPQPRVGRARRVDPLRRRNLCKGRTGDKVANWMFGKGP